MGPFEKLLKGRELPIGTIRKRKDGDYIKTSHGWKRMSQGDRMAYRLGRLDVKPSKMLWVRDTKYQASPKAPAVYAYTAEYGGETFSVYPSRVDKYGRKRSHPKFRISRSGVGELHGEFRTAVDAKHVIDTILAKELEEAGGA